MCIINPLRENMKGLGVGREIKRMYLRGRLESQVRVGVIPEVAGARDLVCMKNFGVFGRVQTASTNGAHWWHSKVILKGSMIATCYLLG